MGSAPFSFHAMAKPAGARCNLACSYCFYFDKPRLSKSAAMSDEVLESFVKNYIAGNPSQEVNFAWQGGEPLLAGLEFFKKAVALQKKYAGSKCITNALQTNATLLDDALCEFFKRENFLLGISIDGPKELHDANRCNSYSAVLNGVKLCLKHGLEFNALVTVNSQNVSHPREIYKFLRGLGVRYMQFIPIVERDCAEVSGLGARFEDASLPQKSPAPKLAKLSRLSPSSAAFGDFLVSIFKMWYPKEIGKANVQNFDDIVIKCVNGGDALCTFAKDCGRALAVEQDGGVYSCDHYVFEAFRLGSLASQSFAEMFEGGVQKEFAAAKRGGLSMRCNACGFLNFCNGDCLKRRLDYYDADDYPTSAMCVGLKKFFAYAAPCAVKIAVLVREGLPPEEIRRRLS